MLDKKPGPEWSKVDKKRYNEDSSSEDEVGPPPKKVLFT